MASSISTGWLLAGALIMCCMWYTSHPPQWASQGRLSYGTKIHGNVECKYTPEPTVGRNACFSYAAGEFLSSWSLCRRHVALALFQGGAERNTEVNPAGLCSGALSHIRGLRTVLFTVTSKPACVGVRAGGRWEGQRVQRGRQTLQFPLCLSL